MLSAETVTTFNYQNLLAHFSVDSNKEQYIKNRYVFDDYRKTIRLKYNATNEVRGLNSFSPYHEEIFRVFYFKRKQYTLSNPIKVKIYMELDSWFAENEELAIFGGGNSRKKAIDDFYSYVIYFSKYYKKLPADKVTGDAVRLKAFFENLVLE